MSSRFLPVAQTSEKEPQLYWQHAELLHVPPGTMDHVHVLWSALSTSGAGLGERITGPLAAVSFAPFPFGGMVHVHWSTRSAVVQVSAAGTPLLSGVISQGDGSGLSTYVPVNAFRSAINLHVK